ncbi:subunit 21 of mediator complex-domain-containing protein [Lipomyces kononenkoae]
MSKFTVIVTHSKLTKSEATKLELARDIMVKTRQIDLLIASLPGAGVSEQDQLARVRNLEQQLSDAEKERQHWLTRQNELLQKCDGVILQLAQRKKEIETADGPAA